MDIGEAPNPNQNYTERRRTQNARMKSEPADQGVIESDSIENMGKLNKILDSAELLPENVEIMMINSLLAEDEQISFLRLYMEKSNAPWNNQGLW